MVYIVDRGAASDAAEMPYRAASKDQNLTLALALMACRHQHCYYHDSKSGRTAWLGRHPRWTAHYDEVRAMKRLTAGTTRVPRTHAHRWLRGTSVVPALHPCCVGLLLRSQTALDDNWYVCRCDRWARGATSPIPRPRCAGWAGTLTLTAGLARRLSLMVSLCRWHCPASPCPRDRPWCRCCLAGCWPARVPRVNRLRTGWA